jgi:nitrogen fixation/metabolism regulation signal transduction histidine kinase
LITKLIEVNGTDFRLTLTDQVINQVNSLKSLYNAAYEDPESFEQVSSEISDTINDIARSVEPEATDSDLDGLIQEIIKVVDAKAAEVEKELNSKEFAPEKKSQSKPRKRKSKK